MKNQTGLFAKGSPFCFAKERKIYITINEDFELTLFDRLEAIRTVLKDVDLSTVYVSYSGGKDSTVLSHLIDEALPGNNIPRVFSNTGIEFNDIVQFVKEQQKLDPRITIITPGKNIKQMLEEDGYPFKSKLHSEMLSRYQKHWDVNKLSTVRNYVESAKTYGRYSCPVSLLYQFSPDYKLKISQKCCSNLKKKPLKHYEKENGKKTAIIGTRAAESGVRQYQYEQHGCVFRDHKGNMSRFAPLSPCSDAFVDWYIQTRNISLCSLYSPPYRLNELDAKDARLALRLEPSWI